MTTGAMLQNIAVMIDSGRVVQARAQLARILAKSPADRNANVMMRHTLRRLGEHRQALYYAEKALAAAPADPDLLAITAQTMVDCGRSDDAQTLLRRALDAQPQHVPALIALANIVGLSGRFVETVDLARRALQLRPNEPSAVGMLAGALIHLGRADEAVLLLKQALLGDPSNLSLLSLVCGALNYATQAAPDELVAAHRHFGRTMDQRYGVRRAQVPADGFEPERRLRVGAISADFREHALMCFFEPLVERFDRARMDLFLYHATVTDDAVSARLRGYPGVTWRAVAGTSPAQIAQRIRDDRIDILLDLSGHTAGGSLVVLHEHPAPLQAAWVAYQCTTGLRAIDYRIVDSDTDPPGFEHLSTETLWRMDPCHFCYRPPLPPAELPDPGAPPLTRPESGGRVTFGCFANMPKINDAVIRLWARVLQRVPNSVMLLRNRGLTQDSARAELLERFRLAGVNADRLLIDGPTGGAKGTIAEYRRVDVALDTFPFQGMTTICEALLMGVPVVAIAGGTSGGRQGVPILRSVGLERCICDDHDAFVSAAAGLASNPDELATLRRSLRDRLLQGIIADEVGWTRRFEATLRQMWRARCAVL